MPLYKHFYHLDLYKKYDQVLTILAQEQTSDKPLFAYPPDQLFAYNSPFFTKEILQPYLFLSLLQIEYDLPLKLLTRPCKLVN